ncbi:DUF2059 domain-containing protein [Oceaniglobus roseus]|uniref:DUF2059 domain-containing protein n=1 Tax=Oceaniglobus roseus TaxID=1737570 RepID=UPI000C7EFB51|nr:DUF2059 domain-containing protein [Kandeliimicrobium roseum]
MLRLCLAAAVTLATSLPLRAASPEEAQRLYDALSMPEVVGIMQQEGMTYGDDLRDELFPGRGGAAWDAVVASLYQAPAMEELVRTRFLALLADVDVAPLIDFFTSDLGKRIVRLELEARRALIDKDVEETAKDVLAEMRQRGDPRLDLLERFIDANDLVDSNVVGAMNSNYAFYSGLLAGNAFDGTMSDEQVLADVWAQEPEIRADTIDWVYAYLALAYQPLKDASLVEYTELSESEPGQGMNQAIFGAFDEMYVTISRALGQAAAQFIAGEDL